MSRIFSKYYTRIDPSLAQLALSNNMAYFKCNRCHKRNSLNAKTCRKCNCARFHTKDHIQFSNSFKKNLIKKRRPIYWKAATRNISSHLQFKKDLVLEN